MDSLFKHWETTFDLYRDGTRVPGRFYDYWRSTKPIKVHTQEHVWKLVYDGYTVRAFECHQVHGDEEHTAHRKLDVGQF